MSARIHTTNYVNTFIAVAEDCPVDTAEVPVAKAAAPTIASLHHDLIAAAPYAHTSDDLIFETYAIRAELDEGEKDAAREAFYAKGQPCLRSSPLGKRYGWGTHHDAEGRVALVAVGTPEYERLSHDPNLTQTRAMRSRRV
ncbi:MAG: DUF6157 family protein [Microbacterium sp.]